MLYFVYLRQPGHIDDLRSDPFWEFGSFGQTGCHRRNLMHPVRSPLANGDRLVFLQGGSQEIRVIGLTPSIEIKRGGELLYLRWDSTYRPIPYATAPILIDNRGSTEFPAILDLLSNTNRATYCGKAASRLRSRTKPIPQELAKQIIARFHQPNLPQISHYLEAVDVTDSNWFQTGLQAGWPTFTQRAHRFAELSGFLPDLPEPRETLGSQGTFKAQDGSSTPSRGRTSCSRRRIK